MILDFFFPEEKEEMQKILYLRQLLKCDHERPLDSKLYFAHLLSLLLKPRELLGGARAFSSLKHKNDFCRD